MAVEAKTEILEITLLEILADLVVEVADKVIIIYTLAVKAHTAKEMQAELVP